VVAHYHGDDGDLKLLMGAIEQAFGGADVERYSSDVEQFFDGATHPTLDRPYAIVGTHRWWS
jgi:hypothetical protein